MLLGFFFFQYCYYDINTWRVYFWIKKTILDNLHVDDPFREVQNFKVGQFSLRCEDNCTEGALKMKRALISRPLGPVVSFSSHHMLFPPLQHGDHVVSHKVLCRME